MQPKITVILFVILLFSGKTYSQNGLENIIVEKYYVSDANDTVVNKFGGNLPIGSVTYRIYVDMLPGYRFQAAYGVPAHELRLATTTLFFNNQDYGSTIPNVIPDRNLKDNTVMLDSWLSAGGASESNLGILKEKDNETATIVNEKGVLQNENPEAGIPIKTRDGLVAGVPPKMTVFGIDNEIDVFNKKSKGSLFSTSNGSWATMHGSIGPDSLENKVLIAQITTDGVFTFELNIQIGTPYGGVEQYVAKNPVGEEKMLASLTWSSAIKDAAFKNNKKTSLNKEQFKH